MRFARFFLVLGALLIFGSKASADEIRVTAYAVFQEPNAGSNQQFIFSSTFLYDLDTNQLVAGSMSTHVTDTFAGTPYTNWVPSRISTGRLSPISTRTLTRSSYSLPHPERRSYSQRSVRIPSPILL